MPWRSRPTPYRVWVSEIMLQQTQVQTVIPYFKRFVRRFPSVRRLARADLQDVLKAWEGLGYYGRARNLHAAARIVDGQRSGRLPRSVRELLKLPGVGNYTAAAIASICFDVPVPAVDGNVVRVATRLWGIADNPRQTSTRASIVLKLASCITPRHPGDFNQAMMELGALVCRPRNPQCQACPLRLTCVARQSSRVNEIPARSERTRIPHYEVAVGIVVKRGQVLIARRLAGEMLGGLWEFPGGKCLSGERLAETVGRKVKEETSLLVRVGDEFSVVHHAYSHLTITLHAFMCEWTGGQPKPLRSEIVRWCTMANLDRYPFPTTGKKIIAAIRQEKCIVAPRHTQVQGEFTRA